MNIKEYIIWFICLEWGIFIGITSSWKWWNLIIHPIAMILGIEVSRLLITHKQKQG